MKVQARCSLGMIRAGLAEARRNATPEMRGKDGQLLDIVKISLSEVVVDEDEVIGELSTTSLVDIAEDHCQRDHAAEDDDDFREMLDLERLRDFVAACVAADLSTAFAMASHLFDDRERLVVETALRVSRRAA